MQFLSHGRDGARFDYREHALHDAHQAYMDHWSAELVARGPTLSADGSQHSGSIHVVSVDDLATARRFTFDEPYARAGWYATMSVVPLLECVSGTMWDWARPGDEQAAAFVVATWTPFRLEEVHLDRLRRAFADADGKSWLFGGVVTNDDVTEAKGMVGAIDLDPTDAERHLTSMLALTPASESAVEVHRWMRGGRPEH